MRGVRRRRVSSGIWGWSEGAVPEHRTTVRKTSLLPRGESGGVMKGKHVILAAAVLVAVVAAAMLWLDLRQERAHGSELAARVAALEVAPAPASAVPGPVTPVPAGAGVPPAVANAPAAAPTAPAPPPATSPQRSGASQSPAAAVLDTMRTPQGQEFAQAMMRGVMGQMYPDIAEKVGVSQQEADALFDLLLRQQQEIAADSIGLLTGSVQDPAARREIQRNLVEKQRAQEAELAAHLGARHGQWEDYQATAAARQQVNELRAALATGSD